MRFRCGYAERLNANPRCRPRKLRVSILRARPLGGIARFRQSLAGFCSSVHFVGMSLLIKEVFPHSPRHGNNAAAQNSITWKVSFKTTGYPSSLAEPASPDKM